MKLLLTVLVLFACFTHGTNVVEGSESHPDATPYPWTANWGLSSVQLQAYLQQFVSTGYMPVHIDGYVIGGVIYFAIIAEQKPGTWTCQYNLTASNFNSTNSYYGNMGYRLQRISVYDNTRGIPNYAGIWINTGASTIAWQFSSGLSYSDLNFQMQKMTAQGYWAIQVEMYTVPSVNAVQYAVIFNTHGFNDPAWFWMFNLPASQYQQQLATLSQQGYRPTQVSAVTYGGLQYYGAIWQQQSSVWQTQWGLTTQTIQSVGQGYVNQGYQFTDIQGYPSSSGTVLYSALWDQQGL